MAEKRSVMSDAVMDIASTLREFREHFREQIPAAFMKDRMTPKQFKERRGVSIQRWKELEQQHGVVAMEEVATSQDAQRGGNPNA
jgi:hypothetical protein|tara:strand:- start:2220 stop:2474 length:255 start_codon:yes stop_codon:yes gene_type:complete